MLHQMVVRRPEAPCRDVSLHPEAGCKVVAGSAGGHHAALRPPAGSLVRVRGGEAGTERAHLHLELAAEASALIPDGTGHRAVARGAGAASGSIIVDRERREDRSAWRAAGGIKRDGRTKLVRDRVEVGGHLRGSRARARNRENAGQEDPGANRP
jgi:hypothetical protein